VNRYVSHLGKDPQGHLQLVIAGVSHLSVMDSHVLAAMRCVQLVSQLY